VSYTHAQITRLGNDLYLRDVGSRNGTYANAQLVSVPHLLREGDVIHVGTTDVTFHATGPTPPPDAPGPTATYPPVAAPLPGAPPAPQLPGAPLTPPAAPAMAPGAPAPPPPAEAVPGPAGPTGRAPAGPHLVVVVGPTVGLSFALVGDSLRVGRDSASATIVLRDQTVSRTHASLDRRGTEWLVTDLGSTNGTSVNGHRLAPQQPVPLQTGARVSFGDVECTFAVS
jgi:pSer/pThr/pTyr-binding forkhead associated (FHA) protein